MRYGITVDPIFNRTITWRGGQRRKAKGAVNAFGLWDFHANRALFTGLTLDEATEHFNSWNARDSSNSASHSSARNRIALQVISRASSKTSV